MLRKHTVHCNLQPESRIPTAHRVALMYFLRSRYYCCRFETRRPVKTMSLRALVAAVTRIFHRAGFYEVFASIKTTRKRSLTTVDNRGISQAVPFDCLIASGPHARILSHRIFVK